MRRARRARRATETMTGASTAGRDPTLTERRARSMSRDYKNSTRPPRGGNGASRGTPAPRTPQSAAKKSPGNGKGVVAGVLIGLLVGVGSAAGVAFYLNRANTPFAQREAKPAQQEETSDMVALPAQPDKPAPPAGPATLEPGASTSRAPDLAANLPANPLLDTPPAVNPPAPATESPQAPTEDKPPRKADKPDTKADAPQTPAEKHAKAEPPQYDFYKILPGNTPPAPQDKPVTEPAKDKESADKGKKIYLQVGAYQKEVDADNLKAKLALLGVEANIQSVNTPEKGLLHRVRIGPLTRSEDVERLRSQLKASGLNPTPVKAD